MRRVERQILLVELLSEGWYAKAYPTGLAIDKCQSFGLDRQAQPDLLVCLLVILR